MGGLRYVTAGESHGPLLVGVLEGLPAGLELAEKHLQPRLRRRQGGYGRGKRMSLETDRAQIVGGVWKGRTTGAPLALLITNRSNRQGRTQRRKTTPRPGHADLAGVLKYGFDDINPVIERSSARETAMRTALGAAACHLLEVLGVSITAHVIALGEVEAPPLPEDWGPERIARARSRSPVGCCHAPTGRRMVECIDQARERGESLGGRVEVIAWGLPPGLGAYSQWDRRLDGRLAQGLMAIQSVKGVEIGQAREASRAFGRQAQDVIVRRGEGLGRVTNRAGGLEGGVSNGEPVVVRLTLKPIPTQRRALSTVDLDSGKVVEGRYVRSDVAVLPAAGVVAEAVMGLVLADALLEKFGGECMDDLQAALAAYRRRLPRWKDR
ncbi:MAG: chorismate synthase [Acidobacteriota bacterium]|nr:chorismate synthase [Acidobacteriota bacterium]